MEDFLAQTDDWFYKKYSLKLADRYWSFKVALNLFLQFDGDNIVETGCVREEDDWGAGMSTYVFGDFCTRYGKTLWSVDNSVNALGKAQKICEDFVDNILFTLRDSVEYLRDFKKPIDLLYLDSKDCELGDDADNTPAQQHQLRELTRAYPKLSSKCVVLLDDNRFENGGKTTLSREYLLKKGFTCLIDFKQSLWVRFR